MFKSIMRLGIFQLFASKTEPVIGNSASVLVVDFVHAGKGEWARPDEPVKNNHRLVCKTRICSFPSFYSHQHLHS